MPSTYTLNNGIELIGTGEQSGTWGDTTNINFQLVDTALDGQVSISLTSTGTSGSPNLLEISDGATSSGRNRLVIFTGTPGAADADVFVRLDPNDAEKIIYVRNDLGGTRTLKLFQGTYSASNDYEVPAGTTAVVFFNGAGTGAVAANVFNNAFFDSLRLGGVSVDKILDEDNMASDDAAALATQQSIKAYVDSQVGTVDTLSEILANGNTTGGNDILFGDTDKAIFGAGSDLEIYSDGANSVIADASTGSMIIKGSSLSLQNQGGTQFYLQSTDGGSTRLYYSGSNKLSTISTGVDITGTAVTDGVTVAGNLSVDGGTIKLDGNYPVGTGNVALGNGALDDGSLSGNFNTAMGNNSLTANTTGAQNTSYGAASLQSNTTGANNTALGGNGPLQANISGGSNTAVGYSALFSNTTASGNTTAGYQAGLLVGDEIVATAIVSGVNYTIQTLGTTDFTLIGASSNTVGGTFTATGAGSGTGTASANAGFNTFIGYQSGDEMIGGSRNTILGSFNGNQNTVDIRNSDYNIVISDGNGNPRIFYNNSIPELVINEQGSDVDFRVESNSNANAIFLDSGNGRLGLFTGSPLVKFQIGDFGGSTSKSGQTALVEGNGFTLNFDTGGNSAGSTHRINFIDRHSAASQGTDGQIGAYIEAARDGSSSTIDLNLGAVNSNGGDAGELLSITAHSGIINKTYPVIEMTAPQLIFNRTDRGTDLKKWRLAHSSEHLEIQALNDAESAAYSAMKFERTATGTTTTIVNPDSRTVGDFRVASSSNANALFVDAGNSRVGINESNLGSALTVNGDILSNWGNSGEQKIGINARSANLFSSTEKTLIITGADAVAGAQAMQGGDVIVRGGVGAGNEGLSIYAGHLYLEGGLHTAGVGTTGGAGKIYMKTAGVERLNIHQAGTIVINESGADANFRVASDSVSNMLLVDAGDDTVYIGTNSNVFGSADNYGMNFFNGGIANFSTNDASIHYWNIENLSTTRAVVTFYATRSSVGNISINTSGTTYNTTSDRRLKDNIEPIADGTEKLMAMNPVSHTWKADPEADAVHGFIAQEMHEIVPEAVSGEPDGEEMMSMDYGRITPVLVAALQDAHNKITALEKRLAELEDK